jgi:glycosyltransferase involved in cell wall biosynthesis
MLISIFTPTHSAKWLPDLYRSLLAQTHREWEWVVLPQLDLPTGGFTDPRVRILDRVTSGMGVGVYKAACCDAAQGDVFLELDHDDLLEPQALASLAAATQPERPQFLYSDCATFKTRGDALVFERPPAWLGCQSYQAQTTLGVVIAAQTFPQVPHNLAYISAVPNHLRAWTRAGYEKCGGYDARFGVGDDYDLIVRSWLAGLDFVYLPECLYLYRSHGENTWRGAAWEIFELTGVLRRRYLDAIGREFARRTGLGVCDAPPGSKTFAYFIDARPVRREFDDWQDLYRRLAAGDWPRSSPRRGFGPPRRCSP